MSRRQPVLKAIAFTAYNRVDYLDRVLDSWRKVRGLSDWHLFASIDPSPQSAEVANRFTQFIRDTHIGDAVVLIQPEHQGVLHHPWVAFESLFGAGCDFVLRVEDDLVVSDDILEYFTWAAETFQPDPSVAAVVGYATGPGEDPAKARQLPSFSPWNWGTWKDRWAQYIGPTWDHDYSTFNGSPGNQSGWDWNLNTRVLPSLSKSCVFPEMSRVQNIGQRGTHAQPHDFPQSPSFRESFGTVNYSL